MIWPRCNKQTPKQEVETPRDVSTHFAKNSYRATSRFYDFSRCVAFVLQDTSRRIAEAFKERAIPRWEILIRSIDAAKERGMGRKRSPRLSSMQGCVRCTRRSYRSVRVLETFYFSLCRSRSRSTRVPFPERYPDSLGLIPWLLLVSSSTSLLLLLFFFFFFQFYLELKLDGLFLWSSV